MLDIHACVTKIDKIKSLTFRSAQSFISEMQIILAFEKRFEPQPTTLSNSQFVEELLVDVSRKGGQDSGRSMTREWLCFRLVSTLTFQIIYEKL